MKKIRVTIPEDIYRLIKNDIEDFGINNNKLCNIILDKYKFKRENEDLLKSQGKPLRKIIQFDLNLKNKEIYYDILKANKVEVEAEFFRELFKYYCSNFKYQRELFVFSDLVKKIVLAIENKNKIKIKYKKEIKIIEPYFIKRDEQGEENYLFCYCCTSKEYKNYKLKNIEFISELPEKVLRRDKKYIDSIRKNFDPFLSHGKIVKVKLTKEGENLLKTYTVHRPKLLNKNNGIFEFEASTEKAFLYFRQFLSEVIILEPLELREKIKNYLTNTLKNYID
ncbi:MAG: hypothetical protein PWP46_1811 [Fusobacteriaceae bacterium]|jgi:hypothetical protein|nr:hypothetical protein [Fusobacteriaceae bacterium]